MEEQQLLSACEDGNTEEVRKLLQNPRININWKDSRYSMTPLYSACKDGHIEVVKLLLNDKRIDVNLEDNHGQTPFYIACKKGHIEIVKLLLKDERIDINQGNRSEATPFCISCYEGHVEIVKLLLNDQRVDVNQAENEYGTTPFYSACYQRHIEVVKLLLNDERVDVNQARNGGSTPFYIACENGHIEIVELLLNEKRISIRKKTNEGETAFNVANQRNHLEIVKLIQEYDTEKRYREYLETFRNTWFFCIENETINKQDFLILNEHLKKNQNIKELKLINCDLTPPNILEILKSLIWKYENLQLTFTTWNIQKIEIEDIKLESTEGLEIIPIEIRNQGTKSIVQYIFDLCKSPKSKPLYRTKLIVVGHENVGKTTLLDCLFPLIDKTRARKFAGLNSEYFTLEGKYLSQYNQGKLCKQYILENNEWNVTKKIKKELFQDKKVSGIEIVRIQKPKEKVELYFENEEIRDKWFERILKLISNKATHGIEVNKHIWKSSRFNQLQNKNFKIKQNGNRNRNENEDKEKKNKDVHVEYSTWDFAGQNDYYNTHHYFLSNRSIFLVLYRMDQGIKGLESLDFWLKSLSSHLNQTYCDQNGKPFYSIIIIGTFLDSDLVLNDLYLKGTRSRRIEEMYNENGLKSPPFYFEVSCSTLQNIEDLREIIFNISLGHSYMGENVPIGYLSIEKSIYELRKLKQNHPIIEIQDLINHVQSQYQSSFEFHIEFTKGALRLLNEWGICIYFDEPNGFSNIVVLDPQYFTKSILGDLFKADESSRQLRSNGIIDYSQLNKIWNGPANLIDTYLSLLQKFEVCFLLKDQQNGDQNENQTGKNENQTEKKSENQNQKKLVIPNLLSEDKTKIIEETLGKKWPITIPLETIEIERIFSFNQVPSEMVSRLLVRFHDKIVDNIIWRRGVLLKHFDDNKNENENVLCLLEVKMEENLFEIKIRGKERNKCLEMMKYIYEEVNIVSRNYGGVKWKECVRSPHFSKGLIDLDDIKKDCKLELKDRKLICPITHFPIYSEDLLFKTGLLDTFDNQIGNDCSN